MYALQYHDLYVEYSPKDKYYFGRWIYSNGDRKDVYCFPTEKQALYTVEWLVGIHGYHPDDLKIVPKNRVVLEV